MCFSIRGFTSDPFEHEYFKVKKWRFSGHNDGNFSNFNEYDSEIYEGDISPY